MGTGLEALDPVWKPTRQAGPVRAAGAVLGASCHTNSFSHSPGGAETHQESHGAECKVSGGAVPLEAPGTPVPPLTSEAAKFLGLWPLPPPCRLCLLPLCSAFSSLLPSCKHPVSPWGPPG